MKNGLFLRVYLGILACSLAIVLLFTGIMVTVMGRQQQASYEHEVRQQAEDVTTYLVELNQITSLWGNRTVRQMMENKMARIHDTYNADVWVVSYSNGVVQYIDSSWNTSQLLDDERIIEQLKIIYDTGNPIRVQGLFDELGKQIVTIGVPWKYNDETVVGAVLLHISVDELRVDPMLVLPTALLAAFAAVLLAMGVAYFVAQAQTRPIHAIRNAVSNFAKGDFTARVEVKSGSSELQELAVSLNSMADELSNIEESRKTFVSNVSHELRSPLTSIQGYVQGMADGTIRPDEQPKYLNVVLDETRRLTRLVSDLLKLSRYESGKMPLNVKRFDMSELMRKCIISFGTRLDEKNVEVEAALSEDSPYVMADEDRIDQVVLNLMDNAIKFLPPSGGKLRITAEPAGKLMKVTVADNGPGISPEDLPHIFDRFYKADKAHTSGRGTGLGLSIVRRIINDHGQEISVESEEGKGAAFSFTLDLAKDQSRRNSA